MKYRHLLLTTLLGVAITLVVVVAIFPLFLAGALQRFPLETLIVAGILAISVLAIVLYIWELVLIGWVMDFIQSIGMPRIRAVYVPLEYEPVGEVIVVSLCSDIATVLECQSVERQMRHLIDEGYCDFVFDFLRAGKVSRHLRYVMLHLAKAARKQAAKLGKPHRPFALPRVPCSWSSTTAAGPSPKWLRTKDMVGLSSARFRLGFERSTS